MIFDIYQTMYSFPNKVKSLPSKLRKYFYCKNEDKATSNIFCDAYFDRSCVIVALNDSVHCILIVSTINRSH